MKNLKQILLLLAFSFNLLIPIHSDWFFGVLAKFSQQFSSPFDNLVYSVFFNFGELGMGLFEMLNFIFISFLIYGVFVVNRTDIRPAQEALNLIASLLLIGVVQYGQDLHPAQTFFELILIFIILFDSKYDSLRLVKDFFQFIIFILFALIDWRNAFCPFIAIYILSIKGSNKVSLASFRAVIVAFIVLMSMPFLRSKFVLSVYESVYSWAPSFYNTNALSFGLPFDFAFLVLLFSLFLILNIREKLCWKRINFILLMLFFSIFSYRIKVLAGLTLASVIVFQPIDNLTSNMATKIRVALEKLSKFSSRISTEGLVFLFCAMIFVSAVSFLKLPITERIFPLLQISELVEQGRCPANYSPELRGYLQYRFAHDANCLKNIESQHMSPSILNADSLRISEFNRLPDRFR